MPKNIHIFQKFLLLVLFSALYFSCAVVKKNNTPTWVNTEKRAELYPNTRYLTGFAQGSMRANESIEGLMNNLLALARKDLTESIQVKISQTGTLTNAEKNNTIQNDYVLQVHSESNFDISNIQILKYYNPVNHTGFVFAYALKEDLIRVYGHGLEAILDLAQGYINQGRRAGLLQDRLRNYAHAIQVLDSIHDKIKLLNTLGNRLWVETHKNLLTQIYNEVPKLLNLNLQIRAQNPPNPAGEFLKPLYAPLVLQVLSNDSLPMANIPLTFKIDNHTIGNSITDADGQAIFIPNLLQSSRAQQLVQVSFNLENYLNTSSKIAGLSIFKPLTVSNSVLWQITPSKIYILAQNNMAKLLTTELQEFFVKHNFSLVDTLPKARFILELDINEHDYSNSGKIHFAYIDLRIKIYENFGKKTIFAKEYLNIKGASISQNQAVIKAIQEGYNILKQDLLHFVGFEH